MRKRFEWKIRNRSFHLGERTLIMGILNVTPDSFSDGGRYSDPDRAFARALELEDEGADLIDIGAESTRPGSARISEAEELRRLIPVLKRLREKLAIPISVDTYKSVVAEKALELGAEVINDPSALTFDPQLSRVVAQYNAGLVLNHMRGTPETWAKLPPLPDVMGSIVHDLDACVHRATRSGVERSRIAVDPGLGFGKRKEQNSEILARLYQLARLEMPILVGPSRKSFLAQSGTRETEFATAAAVTAAVLDGAHIVRVHDVREMLAVVQVADAVVSAKANAADTSDNSAYRAGQPPHAAAGFRMPGRGGPASDRPGERVGSSPSVPLRPRNPRPKTPFSR
jgi:dihydropteroate synthase